MSFFSKIFRKIDPDKEKKFKEELENEGGVEKKDIPAMILSAYLVILLPILGIFLAFYLIIWLVFGFGF